ncbi:hypothetical protein LZ32DRAFT_44884 [Colletotrichum eremochloae]|nr:hypothetical protein LZ32DRAFT_44884 [Colletotrichum eremochloae]
MTETAYETGCPLPEYTTTAACSMPAKRTASPQLEAAVPAAAPSDHPVVQRRIDPTWTNDMSCPGGEADSVLYYKAKHTPYDAQQVLDRLAATGLKYHAYSHSFIGDIFVYIENLPRSMREKLRIMPGVSFSHAGLIGLLTTGRKVLRLGLLQIRGFRYRVPC